MLDNATLEEFRSELYMGHTPGLFIHGGKGLNALKKYNPDENEKIQIEVSTITSFFLGAVQNTPFEGPDKYISSLFRLFNQSKHGAEEFEFVSLGPIPQDLFPSVDIKTARAYATENLIIAFFTSLNSKASQKYSLLTPDLSRVIEAASDGCDQKSLSEGIRDQMLQALSSKRNWRDRLGEINEAAILFRLMGIKFPRLENKYLAPIIYDARKEIRHLTQMLKKILNTVELKKKAASGSLRPRYATMGLGRAIHLILDRMDQYFVEVNLIISLFGLTSEKFLGTEGAAVKKQVARFLFDTSNFLLPDPKLLSPNTIWYRLYPIIARRKLAFFCRCVKSDVVYREHFMDMFRVLLEDLNHHFSDLAPEFDLEKFNRVKEHLAHTVVAVKSLDLKADELLQHKRELRRHYFYVVAKSPANHLAAVTSIAQDISRLTCDKTGEVSEGIRRILMLSAATELVGCAKKEMPFKQMQSVISHILYCYSCHFRPRHLFFRIFVNTYVRPASPLMTKITKRNPLFAKAVTSFFHERKNSNADNETFIPNDLLLEPLPPE